MTIKDKASQGKAVIEQRAVRAGDAARKARARAADSVDTYPVAALVGGLALGAVLGALLPRTRQEEELLGSFGDAINQRARNAATAALDAGQARAEELGISKDAAGKQVGKLIESIAQVAESAGTAAVDAVRH
jgi:hypothetical protein